MTCPESRKAPAVWTSRRGRQLELGMVAFSTLRWLGIVLLAGDESDRWTDSWSTLYG